MLLGIIKVIHFTILAVSLFAMKQYEDSIQCVDQAISIVDINPNYYSNKGTFLH